MKVANVKNSVMKEMAAFMQWVHQVMDSRTMPMVGFYKEDFPKNSIRYKERGEKIVGEYVGIFVGLKAEAKARATISNFQMRLKRLLQFDVAHQLIPKWRQNTTVMYVLTHVYTQL